MAGTKAFPADPWRLKFHLMPPVGWLNDPNGLCQWNGEYHVFFQYSPDNARGGKKLWGHFAGPDLTHLRFVGAPLVPDSAFDKDGVYSGSALAEEGLLRLYYTGNVKQAGQHDYIYTGREGNTVLAESADGRTFPEKRLLMINADYPAGCTCHVRDPKVWKDGGTYRMVQGARLDGRPGEDKGAILFFSSEDGVRWANDKPVTTEAPFGYMWECPDYFVLDGVQVLGCSPQGLPSEKERWQNVYQAGYFILPEDFVPGRTPLIEEPEKVFCEWDMGFDFYAPQTFEDDAGRRIVIGWAGIPDADYDNDPTVKKGWQHALTVPREVTLAPDGRALLQKPVKELEDLRTNCRKAADGEAFTLPERAADIVLTDLPDTPVCAVIAADGEPLFSVLLSERTAKGRLMELRLADDAGRGRHRRLARLAEGKDLRILLDTSLAEIYADGGAVAMTTRFYAPEEVQSLQGIVTGAEACVWDMKETEVRYDA